MADFWSQKEWDELNHIGMKELKRQSRYKNRFEIYSCVIATLALLVSIASLIISIIAILIR